jgi:polyisoprenoid-binding protein YceI
MNKQTLAKEIRRQGVLGFLLLSGVMLLSASVIHRLPSVPANPAAKEIVLALDAAQSRVHYTLGTTLHTVHGSFALNRGTVRIDLESGKAGGEIVADATSGESGDQSRDKKMHKDVLESARFPAVAFRPDRVEGQIPATGSATVLVHGVFTLHGTEHELMVPVQAELSADRWKGTTKFRIPYVEWGLKSPSNFFLKADPVVDVELTLVGTLQN